MKYCQHCGAELHDEAAVCLRCGCKVSKSQQSSSVNNTLGTISKIFMILSSASCAIVAFLLLVLAIVVAIVGEIPFPTDVEELSELIGIIMSVGLGWMAFFYALPLAWCIPMTVSVHKKLSNKEPISVALKVCTLIFVNQISGILLLCMDENQNNLC